MSNRDSSGKFLPGNQAAVGHGRPPKKQELRVLDEVRAKFPPERISAMLEEAYQLATETRSARGVMAVAELVMAYTVGKPKQQEEDDDDSVAMLIQLLSPKPDHPPAIEADYERE